MNKFILGITALLLPTLSMASQSNTPVKYNVVKLSLGNESIENLDTKDVKASVSFLVANNFIFGSSYIFTESDEPGVTLSTSSFQLSSGFRIPISSTIDIVPSVVAGYTFFAQAIVLNETQYADNDYYGGNVVVNAQLGPNFEASLGYNFTTADINDKHSVNANLNYYVTNQIALGAGVSKSFYENNIDGNSVNISTSFAF